MGLWEKLVGATAVHHQWQWNVSCRTVRPVTMWEHKLGLLTWRWGRSAALWRTFQQDCQTHHSVRAQTWPADTTVREICSPVENLPAGLSDPSQCESTNLACWHDGEGDLQPCGEPPGANNDDEEGKLRIVSRNYKDCYSWGFPLY